MPSVSTNLKFQTLISQERLTGSSPSSFQITVSTRGDQSICSISHFFWCQNPASPETPRKVFKFQLSRLPKSHFSTHYISFIKVSIDSLLLDRYFGLRSYFAHWLGFGIDRKGQKMLLNSDIFSN